MNLKEIAIFKRFMGQLELRKNFIKKYKRSIGMTRNPQSIEKYLSNVEPEKVITSAVRNFVTNEAMGYDFWQSVDMSWQEFLRKLRSSHTIEHEEASTMHGFFSALRENWDKEKPWVYEPVSVAQIRYGLKGEETDVTDADTEDAAILTETDDAPLIELVEDKDPLADFEFFDSPTQVNFRLKSDEISINFNNGTYKLTFNRMVSEDIEKAGLFFARLAKNRLGDVCLIFGRSNGAKLSYHSTRNGKVNITLNSKDFTTKLRTLLNIKPDYSILNIKSLPSTSDFLIYKVTKQ